MLKFKITEYAHKSSRVRRFMISTNPDILNNKYNIDVKKNFLFFFLRIKTGNFF